MPLTTLQRTQRAFVSLLLLLARSYNVTTHVTRESSDAGVLKAFKRVARVVRPDKGGSLVDQQRLNVARDRWQEARSEPRCGAGRPAGGGAADAEGEVGPLLPTASPGRSEFRINSPAVMLTYQSVKDLAQWRRFVDFTRLRLKSWKVKFWSATLEANSEEGSHALLMLQFSAKRDVTTKGFAFEGLRPNASSTDLCVEGWCRKKMQQSIDRGFGSGGRAAWPGSAHSGAGGLLWFGCFCLAWPGWGSLSLALLSPAWLSLAQPSPVA